LYGALIEIFTYVVVYDGLVVADAAVEMAVPSRASAATPTRSLVRWRIAVV
jgi:hypothetical protein